MGSAVTEDSRGRGAGGLKRVLLIVVAVALAFLLGAGWQFLRATRAERALQGSQRELAVTRLEATLGAAAIEAQRGNYEIARQLTSDFFTRLQGALEQAPSGARDQLRAMNAQRDALITMLSRSDPESGSLLTRLFLQYRVALHGPERASPIAAPAPATLPDPQRQSPR